MKQGIPPDLREVAQTAQSAVSPVAQPAGRNLAPVRSRSQGCLRYSRLGNLRYNLVPRIP